MSEYGPGITMAMEAEMDKERVMQALRGFLVAGVDDSGEFVYGRASEQECEEYILSTIDHWFYMAKEAADAGRAFERVLEKHGLSGQEFFFEFAAEFEKARKEYDTYLYEHEKAELHEEADDILKG